ncbi:disulfide bond formation protein DsbB [Paraneptunicella aestuarii]|uniref:disulfide bond formation protein DsbB n=1 Tax=Paraneptunicella aestuarii TaxID=2831148 RepID=UPI001E6489A4|nr:disulfide bond formation protein DsbB [Paraneptunicella aestuarii]UAA37936.1 disulfide bond formation protein DsbB [Paraneptunicella aestuarii]
MINFLARLSNQRWAWGTLFFSALALEASALYFQYGMGLEPCIMCIYQRTAVLGVLLSGLLVFLMNNALTRLIGFIGWGVSAIWGLLIAIEHVDIQGAANPFFVTCEIVPNFPVPLHDWVPFFFAATGDCGKIDWEFLTLSMPQWMIVIFAAYSAVFTISLLARLFYHRAI